jgi:DNA-binding CsgD family transcriptional regulator
MATNMPAGKTSGKQEPPISAETGLILLDHSLKVVAFDRGASAIFRDQGLPSAGSSRSSCTLPKELLNTIRNTKISAVSSLRMYLRLSKHEYSCRAFLLEWQNWLSSQPMVAVYLEKVSSSNDAIHEVAIKYQLTNRELEVLRGISLGLSSKIMADRMDISPNTVKAFLRLIMIKMGVTSRAGIVANILNRTTMEANSLAGIPPQRFEYKEERANKAAAGVDGTKSVRTGVPEAGD